MIPLQEHGIYGNRSCFEDLHRWIDEKTSHTLPTLDRSGCLALIGAPGVGKTYGIEKICELLKIHIKKIDSTNCRSIKDLSDLFVKMASTNLEEMLQQTKNKKLLFIDEFEILIQLDRNIPSILYQLIDTAISGKKPLPYIPLVIACNDNVEKKLGDIRRFCKTIHLRIPSEADILLMLNAHTKEKRLKISGEVMVNIAESASGNMQQALQMAHFETLRHEHSEDMPMVIDHMPDINILYMNPTRDVAYRLFEEDIWMNPLRFHENLSREIEMRKGTKQKKHKVYSDILRCMLDWDRMIHSGDLNIHMAMEHLCNAPCTLLPQLERKKNIADATMNEFTKTLSQMSLQCKLKRHTYKDDFPWAHIGNYFYTIKKQRNKKFSDVGTDT